MPLGLAMLDLLLSRHDLRIFKNAKEKKITLEAKLERADE